MRRVMKIRKSKECEKRRQKAIEWKRCGRIIRHHIKNRCKGGNDELHNLLLFDKERENAWHFLFRNKSFLEVAELLIRADKMKRSQQERVTSE